jgi:hypothetical protein
MKSLKPPHRETNFWLLAPPENQKRATLAEDTRLEQIICATDENHRRGGAGSET